MLELGGIGHSRGRWTGIPERPWRTYAANAPAEEQHEGQMVRPGSASGEKVIRGTGSVFADLDFPDAVQREAKLRLAYTLNQLIDGLKLSQAEVAKVLGVSQPKVSALRNYRLAGFSLERLMNLLTALDQDVEIVIRRKPRSRKAARISVVAA
jgi:predicted XRE-type DNA-binding protein